MTERPFAVDAMERGAGWTRLRFDENHGAWVGVPPFPEGDLYGSECFMPDVTFEVEGERWVARVGEMAVHGDSVVETGEALIAQMRAYRKGEMRP